MKKLELKELIREVLRESNNKGILKFNLDDPHSELAFRRALNGTNAYLALHEIHQRLFRPAYKHGYNGRIDDLIDQCPESLNDGYTINAGLEIIDELNNLYNEILTQYNINLDDLE